MNRIPPLASPGTPSGTSPDAGDEAGSATARWCADLVAWLRGAGVQRAVLCPGSRSGPLALAFDAALPCTVLVDERSAAYCALGMARCSSAAVAVVTTSGTAVANLHPAVVEADEAGIPLVVVSADRPVRLRGSGSNQTVQQTGLFGPHVRRAWDLPAGTPMPPVPRLDGPVHVNVPFEEPLPTHAAPIVDPPRFQAPEEAGETKPTVALPDLGPRPLLVLGPGTPPDVACALRDEATVAGVPVLADGLSGARDGAAGTLATFDAWIADMDLPTPTGVLRTGDGPTSKALLSWLTRLDTPLWSVRSDHRPRHLGIQDTRFLYTDPAYLIGRLAWQADKEWTTAWRGREAAARARVAAPSGTGAAALQALVDRLDATTLLWVGSSLPVRDLERFCPRIPGRVLANRGASGIDGVLSAAAGAASVHSGPAWCVLGDLSFQHDIGGLAALRHAPRLRVLLIDNGGGGIFRGLPWARTERFEGLFLTPQDLDVAAACAAFGLSHARTGPDGVAAALDGDARVVQVVLDGAEEARLRNEATSHMARMARSL